MSSIVRKGLFLAVVVFFALLLIGKSIGFYNKSQPILEKSNNRMDTVSTQLTNAEFKQYDGNSVSGSDVISLINTKASSNLSITVKTTANPSGKTYNSASYNIKDISDVNYIEDTASLNATLKKTDNGTVTGIICTQQ